MKFRTIKLLWKACAVNVLMIIFVTCKRENSYTDCLPDVKTTSEVVNTKGIIRLVDTPSDYMIFIAPQGMDTQRYVPCNLPESFEIPNEEIIVSGLVKYTLDPCFTPGCPLYFVITKIGK